MTENIHQFTFLIDNFYGNLFSQLIHEPTGALRSLTTSCRSDGEGMTQYWTILISGAMGLIGAAVGAITNHFLSKSAQREQWIADAKKQEYRELLTALNETFMVMMELNRNGVALGPEEQRELFRSETKSVRIIADRLYTAETVVRLKVMDRWTGAVMAFRKTLDIVAFGNETNLLCAQIRDEALDTGR